MTAWSHPFDHMILVGSILIFGIWCLVFALVPWAVMGDEWTLPALLLLLGCSASIVAICIQ